MAEYDGIPLLNADGSLSSGGVFRLDHKTLFDTVEVVDRSSQVEIRNQCQSVVARTPAVTSYEEALDCSMDIAQRGLDMLSVRGIENLNTINISNEHLVWWAGAEGLTIRIFTIKGPDYFVRLNIPLLAAKGEAVPAMVMPMQGHDSFRYFRLSQTTDDLFDAYRNLYLALESILSDTVPIVPGERETAWLKRAFVEVSDRGLFDFELMMPTSAEPIDAAFQDIYASRNKSFHAKVHAVRLLPQRLADRQQLHQSLTHLLRLYLALAENRCGFQRMSMNMSVENFQAVTGVYEETLQLHITNQISACEQSDGPAPPDEITVAIPTRFMVERQEPFTKFFFGSTPIKDLAALPYVEGCIAATPDKPICCDLGAHLTLTGFTTLETVFGYRISMAQQPKTKYGL